LSTKALVGDDPDLLVTGGKLLALVTAFLPVTGFLIRWISFGANPSTSGAADTLAWSAPITQLAATGLPSVAIALLIVVVVGLSDRIARLPPHEYGFSWLLVLALVVFLGFFGYVVATSPWPFAVLTVFAALVGVGIGLWGRRLSQRGLPLTYRHGWLLAVPIMVVASAAIGLEGTPAGTTSAGFTFVTGSQMGDGQYLELGEGGASVFLQSCSGRPALDAVGQTTVLSETGIVADGQQAPSVVGMLLQRKTGFAGYQRSC
jgi:hypothetical protein